MFFKRKPKETPDELANRLQKEGKIDRLETELQAYSVQTLSPKDKASYFHLWGIAAFRRGDRDEAFSRYKAGVDNCPDSSQLLFSLGQEYEYRRAIEQMFDCFDRCSFPDAPAAFFLASARYAYLWNRPDKAFAYLQPIGEAYFQLGIADDHFVYVRGLPFWGQTWSMMMCFAQLQGDFSRADDYLQRSIQRLSDYDFESPNQFYSCLKSDDFGEYLSSLSSRLQSWDSKFPSGYQRVQLAGLSARSQTPSSAVAALENVPLTKEDFPWLADVITIHRAWAYSRSGSDAQEKEQQARFFEKQRLLFEPDHAVNFGFLEYQESLKCIYQNSRTGQST